MFASLSPAAPFDPTYFVSCTVSNVICCLVFGQRFSYDDDHFLYLLQTISDTIKFGSSPWGQVRGGGLLLGKPLLSWKIFC